MKTFINCYCALYQFPEPAPISRNNLATVRTYTSAAGSIVRPREFHSEILALNTLQVWLLARAPGISRQHLRAAVRLISAHAARRGSYFGWRAGVTLTPGGKARANASQLRTAKTTIALEELSPAVSESLGSHRPLQRHPPCCWPVPRFALHALHSLFLQLAVKKMSLFLFCALNGFVQWYHD